MPFRPLQAPPHLDTDGLRAHGEDQAREIERAWGELEGDISTQLDDLNTTLTAAIAAKVAKAGDTMTGLLVLSANPSAALGAATKQYVDAATVVSPIRNYLTGLTLSTAGASTTFSVAAGVATDSTNVESILLAAAISKTTGAWAVGTGNGGLDTGTILNDTWYHAYGIKRPDTGVVDACVSLSAAAPTTGGNIPSAYTRSRRIGSMKTNGSGQWTKFSQNGDEFLWDVSVLDVNGVTPGVTTAQTKTLTVPTGVQVRALCKAVVRDNSAASSGIILSSFDESDQAFFGTWSVMGGPAGQFVGAELSPKRTNTSAQIRARVGTTTTFYSLMTNGWLDTRGQ
jgi:hypothetical protein